MTIIDPNQISSVSYCLKCAVPLTGAFASMHLCMDCIQSMVQEITPILTPTIQSFDVVALEYEGQVVRFLFEKDKYDYYVHNLKKYFGVRCVSEYIVNSDQFKRTPEEIDLAIQIQDQISWLVSVQEEKITTAFIASGVMTITQSFIPYYMEYDGLRIAVMSEAQEKTLKPGGRKCI